MAAQTQGTLERSYLTLVGLNRLIEILIRPAWSSPGAHLDTVVNWETKAVPSDDFVELGQARPDDGNLLESRTVRDA